MLLNDDIIARLAGNQGLVRVPLFEAGRAVGGQHDVLLDGPLGSFAISDARSEMAPSAALSWAWSANVPHHVSLTSTELVAVRWDRPQDGGRLLSIDTALGQPDILADFLRAEALDTTRDIVAQSLRLFRSVRVAVHQVGGADAEAVEAYLAVLDALSATDAGRPDPEGIVSSPSLDGALSTDALFSAVSSFQTAEVAGRSLKAWSSLSVRHASGPIFQEAHYDLTSVPTRDLFGFVRPVAAKPTGGGVHFTPPTLARSLAEQAILRVGDLTTRPTLAIADYTCGSGAFLVECMRALARAGFVGRLRVIGRDISPLAVQMAAYVLRHAGDDWAAPLRPVIEVAVADALTADLPSADIIVMNPPFASASDLDDAARAQARDIVPGVGRFDHSMAFLERALARLLPGGALAAIMPARVIEGNSTRGWRNTLAERFGIPFVAIFDDVTLFDRAVVRIGALVCSSEAAAEATVVLRAGRNGTGDALRALRRDRALPPGSHSGQTWSISRRQAVADAGAIVPAAAFPPVEPYTAVSRGEGLAEVEDLFWIYQGVRSGMISVFVLSEAEYQRLPSSEQAFFRNAVTNDGIADGRVIGYARVFHPYDAEGPTISDEATLVRLVPEYYRRHLAPNKEALSRRRRLKEGRWWLLAEARLELLRRRLFVASKYFAGPRAFVVDWDGSGLVLQGFGWIATGALEERLAAMDEAAVRKVALAYVAFLNSDAFFAVLGRAAPSVQGGQFDLSARHLDGLPMPDLTHPNLVGYLTPLAAYGDRVYGPGAPSKVVGSSNAHVERLAEELLAPGSYARSTEIMATAPAMPTWMVGVLSAGREEQPRRVRSQLLQDLQDAAYADRFEEIEVVLDHADLGALHDLALVTLVRGTFPMRRDLPGWVSFRNRVSAEFAARGHAVDDTMYGLF